MENLYRGPERFGEPSNDLVVFEFSFFTLATQLSLSHRGVSYYLAVAWGVGVLLLLFLLCRIRYSGSLETGKVSRAKEGYPSQGRLAESWHTPSL